MLPTQEVTPKTHLHAQRPKVGRWLSALLDLLYPPRCVACGRAGEWLCKACIQTIPTLTSPLCVHCGEPQSHPGLCAACRRGNSQLAGLRSVSYHFSPLREAIHTL